MITTDQRDKLRQFFGAYFHQDWDIEFGTPDQALSAFIRQQVERSALEELSRSIVTFVHEHPDDADLDEALFKELGCEYFPPGHGILTRAWLLSVAATLERGRPS